VRKPRPCLQANDVKKSDFEFPFGGPLLTTHSLINARFDTTQTVGVQGAGVQWTACTVDTGDSPTPPPILPQSIAGCYVSRNVFHEVAFRGRTARMRHCTKARKKKGCGKQKRGQLFVTDPRLRARWHACNRHFIVGLVLHACILRHILPVVCVSGKV